MSLSWNDIKSEAVSGSKHYKLWKAFYFLNAVVGIFLLILEIEIYRKTIIDFYIPLIVILIVGTIAFIFNKRHYQKIYSLHGIFFPLMHNIFSWGFISCYPFMDLNYYFANKDIMNHTFPIKYKSSLPGGRRHRNERQPLIAIDYFGFEKELVFRFSQTEKVKRADSANIESNKGFLGFDILVNCYVVPK